MNLTPLPCELGEGPDGRSDETLECLAALQETGMGAQVGQGPEDVDPSPRRLQAPGESSTKKSRNFFVIHSTQSGFSAVSQRKFSQPWTSRRPFEDVGIAVDDGKALVPVALCGQRGVIDVVAGRPVKGLDLGQARCRRPALPLTCSQPMPQGEFAIIQRSPHMFCLTPLQTTSGG